MSGAPEAAISIASAPFLLIALAAVLILRSARAQARRVEILLFASLLFAALATATLVDAACLAGMVALGWFSVKIVTADKRRLLLAAALAAIVGEFVLTRQLVPGERWLAGVALGRTIGLSYVMFRILHLIIDAHSDELPGPIRLHDYLCYLFFFPTFLAGPIQRLPDFAAALVAPPARQLPAEAVFAIVRGYFKFAVLAGLFFTAFNASRNLGPAAAALPRAAAFVCFAAYLYVSFSGYTDVVRGVAGLVGFRLPINFDRPLQSANFLDVWSRWHISLSDWFKLYLFNPLTKELIAAAERPRLVPYLGTVGFFATFFMMGLWHGTSVRFALYGLVLGAGVSIDKLFQTAMTTALGRRRYGALMRRPAYAAISRGLAVSYFVLALGFFWIPAAAAPVALGRWAAAAALVCLGMLALAAAGITIEAVERRLPRLPTALLCGLEAAAIAVYFIALHGTAPPLIYQFF